MCALKFLSILRDEGRHDGSIVFTACCLESVVVCVV